MWISSVSSAAGGAFGLAAVRLVPADAGSSAGWCSCCVFASEDQFVSFCLAAGGAVGQAAVRLSLVDVGSSVGRCSSCVFASEDQFVSFSLAAGGALGLAAVRLVPADAGSSVGRCSCCVLVSEDQFGSLIKQRAVLFLHQVAEDINEKIVGRFFQPHQSPPAQLQQVDCPGCNGAFQVPAYSASAQCLTCGTVTQLLPPAPAAWSAAATAAV